MASDPLTAAGEKPSAWAEQRARDILVAHGRHEVTYSAVQASIARALDAARLDAIAETEQLVRETCAQRGVAWPGEALDFGGMLDLALSRALDAARHEAIHQERTRIIGAVEKAIGRGVCDGGAYRADIQSSIHVALNAAREQGRQEGRADDLAADVALRRDYGRTLDILDASNSPPCWDDIVDAAREEGRREREVEIVAWAEKQATLMGLDKSTLLDAARLAAYQQVAQDIKDGAGRKEDK